MALELQALNSGTARSVPSTTISLTQMLRPQIVGGKVGVSVRDFTVYTQFKHINAMPASGEGGYSASRLRLLDTLIDRLIKLKESSVETEEFSDAAGMSDEAIDALIDEYAQRYQNLSARSSEGLNAAMGTSFGIAEGGTAQFLNLLA